MVFNKKEYDINYNKKNILQKLIKFNKIHDKEIIEYIQTKDNFNKYIHDLIEKDMKESQK